jgi:hypothetical protein
LGLFCIPIAPRSITTGIPYLRYKSRNLEGDKVVTRSTEMKSSGISVMVLGKPNPWIKIGTKSRIKKIYLGLMCPKSTGRLNKTPQGSFSAL